MPFVFGLAHSSIFPVNGIFGHLLGFFFTYQRLYIDKIPSVREQDSFFYQASHKLKEKEPSEGLSMSKR